NDRHIILFNPDGDGKIAELHGTINAGTQNVGTLVPGTGTHMGNFNVTSDRSETFQEKGGKELAMISWLGGDMPDSVLMNAHSPCSEADGMAADLTALPDMLRQEIKHSAAAGKRVETAYVGNSYGGTNDGAAETCGVATDQVVHISSAGLSNGVNSTDD